MTLIRGIISRVLNLFGPTPLSRRKALWGLVLIAPNTIGLFFFFGVPVLMTFWTSLQQWNGIQPAQYIGLENFQTLAQDDKFRDALTITLKLVGYTVPAEMVLALGVALLLNIPLRGRGLLRMAYFIPVVTSTVAASVVWTNVFQPESGLLSKIVASTSWADRKWLTDPKFILFPIAAVTVWQRIGFDMVLFLSGLQAIPNVLYDAATIDGANRWQRFRYVTLPMLSPTTFLVMVLAIINSFLIFDQAFIITARFVPGGVLDSATTLTYYMYERAFVDADLSLGYASAVALAQFAIILAITLVQLAVQRYWVYYEAGEAEA
ncbi:MAG: sugar ABC transporter permease [Chloroflexi bacterium]|nr:sugar ABC transporter permease [Chloroflexota bacterium]